MSIQENEYRSWLANNSKLSHKGQNDLISRLRRGDRLVPITNDTSFDQYSSELKRHVNWASIPPASQQSIMAAAKKYLTWRDSSSR